MNVNPLDVMSIEVRKLQSLDTHSKEYKKAIKDFRFRYKVLVGSPLNFKEQDKLSYYYGYKYKKYCFSLLWCISVEIIAFVSAYLVIGDFEVNKFTKLQAIGFVLFISVLIIDNCTLIFFTYKVRKSMDDRIDELIKEKK